MEGKRRLCIGGIVLGVYLGFRYALPVLIPFLAGWLLAAWIYPLAVKVERRVHINRTAAGAVCIGLLAAAVGALLWWAVGEGLNQVRDWISHYPQLEDRFYRLVHSCCGMLENSMGIAREESYRFFMGNMERMRRDMLQGIGVKTVAQATLWLKWGIAGMTGVVISVISGVFIIRDMEELKRKARSYPLLRGCRRVLKRLKQTTAVYLKAQFLIMLVISGLSVAGFWLMKSPYYLLLGIALGLLDALPLIGTGLFLYPAAAVCLLWGRPGMAVGCVILELTTSFAREFLEPRLIGKRLGVYPIVILAAVYLGLVFYGPAGVVLGPLSLSLMYEIGKEWDVWD